MKSKTDNTTNNEELQKVESSEVELEKEDIKVSEEVEDTEISENTTNIEDIEKTEDSEEVEETEETEEIEVTEDIEETEETEETEEVEEVEETEEIEEIEAGIESKESKETKKVESKDKKQNKKKKKKKNKKTKNKKDKKSTKEKLKEAKGNIGEKFSAGKRFGKKLLKILTITFVTVVIGYLVFNLSLQVYFNGNREVDVITMYDNAKIQRALTNYGNGIVRKSRAVYDVKNPEFYKLFKKGEEITTNYGKANKVILESKVYGVQDDSYYVGTVIKIQSPLVQPTSFFQVKNFFGHNEDIYYSLIELDKTSLKITKEYSTYIGSFDKRFLQPNRRGVTQDLASEYGLSELENKYAMKFSDIYRNLRFDNLFEKLENPLIANVLRENVITTFNKEISDREVELIEAALYKEINNLKDNHGIPEGSAAEVSEKLKSLIDSLKLPRQEFGSLYGLIQSGVFEDGTSMEFIPNAGIIDRIKYKIPFMEKEVEKSYKNFITKFDGAYLSDFEIYSNDEELYTFLNYRKDLGETPITTTVLITFNKESGNFGYISEKSSKLEFELDKPLTDDELIAEKKEALSSHLLSRVNLYKTDSIMGGDLSDFNLNFLNDKDFISYLSSDERMSKMLLRSEITNTKLSLEFTKEDIVNLIDIIEEYNSKKFQSELSEVLRESKLDSLSELEKTLFKNYDILAIEKFDTEDYKVGFEIYDKTHEYGSELKNPIYIIAQ